MSTPLVTCRSTCFNHGAFVLQSLRSVAAQDYPRLQWIIVDDGSSDESLSVIRSFLARNHLRLRRRGFDVELICDDGNRGFVYRLNQILSMAKGQFICGLSTDDVMAPGRVSKAAGRLLRHSPEVGALFGDVRVIDEQGRDTGSYLARRWLPRAVPEGDVYQTLLESQAFLPTPSVMVRRDVYDAVGPYDETVGFEDYDMWLRIADRFSFAFQPETLVHYRLHDNNHHKSIHDVDRRMYWIYRKQLHRREGRERLVDHYALLWLSGDLNEEIRSDFSTLELPKWRLTRRAMRFACRQPRRAARRLSHYLRRRMKAA